MIAEIDKDGNLSIERAGKLKSAACPCLLISDASTAVKCGDWCSQFGEIENLSPGVVVLQLCHREIKGKITDRR